MTAATVIDLACMTVASAPGTGTVTLGSVATNTGAGAGVLSFADAGAVNGATYRYCLTDGNSRELCLGTYNSTAGTLTRTTLIASVSGTKQTTPITASSGTIVSSVMLAEDVLQGVNNLSELTNTTTARANLGVADWINVKTFGATGNGSTDDTTSINNAIAALNTAGSGVLYFPIGTYKVTSALTAITANCMIIGDGMGTYDQTNNVYVPITAINCTSTTAQLFTINGLYCRFKDIFLHNTGTTPTAGSGVTVTNSSSISQRCDFDTVMISGFYINADIQIGYEWSMNECYFIDPVTDSVKIQNTLNSDAGDWQMNGCAFYGFRRAHNSGVNQLSSGGGKIVNCKVNCDSTNGLMTYGFTGGPGSSSILLISNCSFENFSTYGINITTGGTGGVIITNCQFGCYTSGSNAANLTNATGVLSNVTVLPTGGSAEVVLGSGAVFTINNCLGPVSGTPTFPSTFNGISQLGSFTIATLPTASATYKGARAVVTNGPSTTPSFGAALGSTGSNLFPVYCDGSSWHYG